PGVPAGLTCSLAGRRCRPARAREAIVVACDALAGRREALHAVLGELPESKRRLVTIHYFDGKSLREAAGLLGKSYATIKRWHDWVKGWLAKRLAAVRTTPVPMSDVPEQP